MNIVTNYEMSTVTLSNITTDYEMNNVTLSTLANEVGAAPIISGVIGDSESV